MAQQADKRISLTSATVALYDQCYPQTLWPQVPNLLTHDRQPRPFSYPYPPTGLKAGTGRKFVSIVPYESAHRAPESYPRVSVCRGGGLKSWC